MTAQFPDKVPVGLITIFHPEEFGVKKEQFQPVEVDREERTEQQLLTAPEGGAIRDFRKGRWVVDNGQNLLSEARTVAGQEVARILETGNFIAELVKVSGDAHQAKWKIEVRSRTQLPPRLKRADGQLTREDFDRLVNTIRNRDVSLRAAWVNPLTQDGEVCGFSANLVIGPAWERRPHISLPIAVGENGSLYLNTTLSS